MLPGLSLWALALGAGTGVRAQEAFTPDDYFDERFATSWAQVQYTSSGSDQAWVPSFPSLSQWSDPKGEELLYPRMSCPGSLSPNLQLSFPLTSVRFYGFLENASEADKLELRIDGRTVASKPSDKAGILIESPELLWGYHNVMLDLYGGNATIHVENISLTTGMKGRKFGKVRQDLTTVTPEGKLNEQQFRFEGDWNVTRILDPTNRTIGECLTRATGGAGRGRAPSAVPLHPCNLFVPCPRPPVRATPALLALPARLTRSHDGRDSEHTSRRRAQLARVPEHPREHVLHRSRRHAVAVGPVLDGRVRPAAAAGARGRPVVQRRRAVRDPRDAVRGAARPDGALQREHCRR